MANSPVDHPYKIEIRPCTIRPERFRWQVMDGGAPRRFSGESFKTQGEAFVAAQYAIERLASTWRMRG